MRPFGRTTDSPSGNREPSTEMGSYFPTDFPTGSMLRAWSPTHSRAYGKIGGKVRPHFGRGLTSGSLNNHLGVFHRSTPSNAYAHASARAHIAGVERWKTPRLRSPRRRGDWMFRVRWTSAKLIL